jgi:hypothetical protein
MTSEAWAAIIAAVIGVIGTILATKFDDIAGILRRPLRKVAGDWDSISHRVSIEPDKPSELHYESKQVVTLTQKGDKVKGVWIQTEVREGHVPYKFHLKGRIAGSYFLYESTAADSERFMISSAMLYMHPGGREMFGYFIANGGRNDPKGTWIGYTELKRKG